MSYLDIEKRNRQLNGHIIGPAVTLEDGYHDHDFDNGDKYQGHFKGGKKNGKGKYIWSDGRVYDGVFVDDVMTGKGTWTSADGSYTYTGSFSQSKKHGQGKISFKNGSYYDGNWVNDMREGEGEFDFGDGNKYVGEFRGNKKSGEGTFYFKDGSVYKGAFLGDQMSGHGELTQNGKTWKGTFKDGKKHGKIISYREEGGCCSGKTRIKTEQVYENGKLVSEKSKAVKPKGAKKGGGSGRKAPK